MVCPDLNIFVLDGQISEVLPTKFVQGKSEKNNWSNEKNLQDLVNHPYFIISPSTVVNAGWRRSRTIWCTIRHIHEHRSYSSLWRLWKQFASKKDWGFELAPFTSWMQCLTPAYYENCCHIRMIDRLFDHSQFQWDTKCTDKHWPDTHCPLVFPLTVQNSSAGVSK